LFSPFNAGRLGCHLVLPEIARTGGVTFHAFTLVAAPRHRIASYFAFLR